MRVIENIGGIGLPAQYPIAGDNIKDEDKRNAGKLLWILVLESIFLTILKITMAKMVRIKIFMLRTLIINRLSVSVPPYKLRRYRKGNVRSAKRIQNSQP
jgi:hypothetical protein